MADVAAAVQRCRSCGGAKALDAFDRRADTGGHHKLCRDCRREYQRERWRRAHPPKDVITRRIGAAEEFTCTRCKQTKSAEAFPPRHTGGLELQTWCRACFAAVNARHYSADPRRGRAHSSVRRARRASELRVRLVEYLLGRPCIGCGSGESDDLRFYAIGRRARSVAGLSNSGRPWEWVIEFIRSREIWCVSCVRAKSGGERARRRTRTLSLPPVGSPLDMRMCTACGLAK